MGQSQSRRSSTSSQEPLILVKPRDLELEKAYELFYGSDAFHGIPPASPGITKPAAPEQLRRLSELIDPHDLLGIPSDQIAIIPYMGRRSSRANRNKKLPKLVQSPRGTTMGAVEFINNPNRPLTIRERQEHIQAALKKTERNESMGSSVHRPKPVPHMPKPVPHMPKPVPHRPKPVPHRPKPASHRSKPAPHVGNLRVFENAKIEQGRRAYEKKTRTKKTGPGCLSGCFGGKPNLDYEWQY